MLRLGHMAFVIAVSWSAASCGSTGPSAVPEPTPTSTSTLFAFVTLQAIDSLGGALWSIGVDPQTGRISGVDSRPAGYQPWSVRAHPSGRLVFSTDTENVRVFGVSTSGHLTDLGHYNVGQGGGGHYMALTASGRFLYVSTAYLNPAVWGFEVDAATGVLSPIPGSPFAAPPDAEDMIVVGNFLYVGIDYLQTGDAPGIHGFAIDPETGALQPLPGSPFDRQVNTSAHRFAVSPSGNFLYAAANGRYQDSVLKYRIDLASGALVSLGTMPLPVGSTISAGIATSRSEPFLFLGSWSTSTTQGNFPLDTYTIDESSGELRHAARTTTYDEARGLALDPSGEFIYVCEAVDFRPGRIEAYRLDHATGALSAVEGSPFQTPVPDASQMSFGSAGQR